MKKLLSLILAVLMLATCFAGCGSEEVASTDDSQDDAKKTVVVGYTNYEPMNYKDESGKLIGFDTELAEAVFKKLDYQVVFKLIDWDQKYTELNSGTISCIWNGFTANTADDDGVARKDKVDFSYNYMGNKQVVVAKSDFAATVKDVAALSGKVGAVESSSAGDTYLTEKLTGAIKKGVASQLDAMKELSLGAVDFVVVDEQLAKAYIGKGDYASFGIVENVYSDAEYYAIGFKKGSELTALVNGALEELAADGTIATLAEKYGVSNTAITDFSDQK